MTLQDNSLVENTHELSRTGVFNTDDMVYRTREDGSKVYEDIFRIVSIRYEESGGFHDGWSLTTYATLYNMNTHDTEHDVILRYTYLSTQRTYNYAIPVIILRKNSTSPSTSPS